MKKFNLKWRIFLLFFFCGPCAGHKQTDEDCICHKTKNSIGNSKERSVLIALEMHIVFIFSVPDDELLRFLPIPENYRLELPEVLL